MSDVYFEGIRVHALLIPHKEKIGLVSLSKEYSFLLVPSVEPSDLHRATLKVDFSKSDPVFARELAIDSLTVMYGENGSGKTHSMIEACNSLCTLKGERKVAVVWEQDGQLYFDPGSVLGAQVKAVHGGAEVNLRRISEPLGVAFYTTSPFEASKRRSLKSNGVIDVTPVFSPANPFEGSALIKAFSKLPVGFPFISQASVKLQVRVPSLRSVLDKIVPGLKKRRDYVVSDVQRRALARLDQLLELGEAQAFAIHLLVASQRSIDQSLDILIDVAGESGLLELHAKDAEDEIKNRLKAAVSRIVTTPLYESSQFLSSQFNSASMMLRFLDSELPGLTKQLGRKTTLGRLSKEFDLLSVTSWEHLNQASRLGLLKWSFRDLSSGQVALLLLFSSLASAISRLPESKTIFIFVDEGEMFMHPAWQRRYIRDLVLFF